MKKIVLQKAIADAGVCSRRAAEELIRDKRVKVNGKVAAKLGERVDPEKDQIAVNGKLVSKPEDKVYYLLNKPKGVLSTVRDEHGRKTVLDLIKVNKKVVPVGRLDSDTTGLLILTNDGDLVYELTHPKFEHEKEYQALIQIPQYWAEDKLKDALKRMERGVKVAGDFKTSPAKVRVIGQKTNDRYLISVTIHEGHKHQVRQMIDASGLTVVDLKRVRMGSLNLGALPEGASRELTAREVGLLKKV